VVVHRNEDAGIEYRSSGEVHTDLKRTRPLECWA
jgi:hypothetical protein